MPSPMDECDNVVNIETSPSTDQTLLKRKLDGNSDELSFPCKKVAMSPIPKLPSPEGATTPTTASPSASMGTQVKLTKAERELLKAEKSKEREAERQKREEEKQKREEEKQKREEERVKKVKRTWSPEIDDVASGTR
jgi:cell division protein FtsN